MEDLQQNMPELYAQPLTVQVNTADGYSVNPLTGDSIHPLINSLGDTVRTGMPIRIEGTPIDPDRVLKPERVPAGKPGVFPVSRNVYKLSGKLPRIQVNMNQIHSSTSPGYESSYLHLNSTGDTLPTGVPITVSGKAVPFYLPEPVDALPPYRKEKARAHLTYMDVDQGLHSDFIHAILEDSRGNMWFGGQGGIGIYNGETFTHISEKGGLNHKIVKTIVEDSQGNIWIGTSGGGVTMYNGDSFIHYTEKEGLSSNKVYSILEDRMGNMWFGTWGGGVSKFDGETLTHFTKREGLSNNRVYSILEDRTGNMWFGTLGGGVNMYDGEVFTYFTEEEGLSSNYVTAGLEDSQGNLWFGTPLDGLNKFDGESFTHITKNEGLSSNKIYSMHEDSQGKLWFGTWDGGVNMYDGESITYFTEKEGLTKDIVFSLLEDSRGIMWIGTLGGGVNIFNRESFTHFSQNAGLRDYAVYASLEDSLGNIWFGTHGGGISMYNGHSVSNLTMKEGLGANAILSMEEDSQGRLWIGTEGAGVNLYDGVSFTKYTKKEGLSDNVIYVSLEDNRGNLWFGTWRNGISMFDGKKFTHFREKEGLSNNYISAIMEDREGNLWFGTMGGGVSKYDGEFITHFTEKEGLSQNTVLSILEDSRGRIWFGTNGQGVSLFRGDLITHFPLETGVSHGSVHSIHEDSSGVIWLGTENGLTSIKIESHPGSDGNTIFPEIHSYKQQDGLKGTLFFPNNALLDSDNRFWWGSNKSLVIQDMNSFGIPEEAPEVQLSRIDLNGEYLDLRQVNSAGKQGIRFDGMVPFYNYPLNLSLHHDINHLTFHFAVTGCAVPPKALYSYKIDGLNETWSLPSADAKADYRNLPHGTYTFKLRAIGEAHRWSEAVAYTFTILPPLWHTRWAYLTYVLLLALIVLRIRRYEINRAKLRTELRIERIQAEKTLELDKLKNRFFTNISHEFRTPLTLLLGPIEDSLKTGRSMIETERSVVEMMKRNALRLKRLINQLLDISKLESGKMKIRVSEGDLTAFVRVLSSSFLSLAESKRIRYEIQLQETKNSCVFDPDKVEKILTNLLSNAFKYTPQGGSVLLRLSYMSTHGKSQEQTVVLLIRDSGRGISADHLPQIFERFYKGDSEEARDDESMGIGLALSRELVELLRGSISVESELGKGSSFKVSLPVSSSAFSQDEFTVQSSSTDILKAEDRRVVVPELKEGDRIGLRLKANRKLPAILVVEDNPDLRTYLTLQLKPSYTVLEANNGQEGLQRAIETIPDLLISDVMMPVMGGSEMCSRLKKDGRTSHIPIIMLTAKADKRSKLEGLEKGADDYIVKPFDAEELLVRVKNLIQQREKLKDKFRMEFLTEPGENSVLSPEDQLVRKILDLFNRHMGNPKFNVDQMTNELHMSPAQLFRKVNAVTGHTPADLLRKLRLKKAASMFRAGHDNVTQVMHEVGFGNHSYFAKCFRETFGVPPSEFLKQIN